MEQALLLAREAARAEVPVGCVIVRGGEIVGRGRNRREEKQATCSHARWRPSARRTAPRQLAARGLHALCDARAVPDDCAGAILSARIPRVYYGARDRAMGRLRRRC